MRKAWVCLCYNHVVSEKPFISSPIFLISTGLAIMFGSGVSIVAAIHLSKKRHKAANINVTQAVTVSMVIMLMLCTLIWSFPDTTARLFGSSKLLEPLVTEYILYVLPSFFGSMLLVIGMFVIRLDGAPKFGFSLGLVPNLPTLIMTMDMVSTKHLRPHWLQWHYLSWV